MKRNQEITYLYCFIVTLAIASFNNCNSKNKQTSIANIDTINHIINQAETFYNLKHELISYVGTEKELSLTLKDKFSSLNFWPFWLHNNITLVEKEKLVTFLCNYNTFMAQHILMSAMNMLSNFAYNVWNEKKNIVGLVANNKVIIKRMQEQALRKKVFFSTLEVKMRSITKYAKKEQVRINNEKHKVLEGFILDGEITYDKIILNTIESYNLHINNSLNNHADVAFLKLPLLELNKLLQLYNHFPVAMKIGQKRGQYVVNRADVLGWLKKVILHKDSSFQEKSWARLLIKDFSIKTTKLVLPFEVAKAVFLFQRKDHARKLVSLNKRDIPIFLMGDHNASYLAWQLPLWNKQIPKQKYVLIHVDTHNDLNQSKYPQYRKTLQQLKKHQSNFSRLHKVLNNNFLISGFISPAIQNEIVGKMYWVIPQWAKPGSRYFSTFFNTLLRNGITSRSTIFGVVTEEYPDGSMISRNFTGKLNTLKKNQRTIVAEKVFSEELPRFSGKEAILLDIDLDFFNNSGWDTQNNASPNLSLQQIKDNIDRFVQTLRNKNILPSIISVADSPHYSKREDIPLMRDYLINRFNKYYKNKFPIIQLKPSYDRQILEYLVTLKEHMSILEKSNSINQMIALSLKKMPSIDDVKSYQYTSSLMNHNPLPVVIADFHLINTKVVTMLSKFQYAINYFGKTITRFYQNYSSFEFAKQLQQLSTSLAQFGKSKLNVQKIKQLNNFLKKIIWENEYEF